MGMPLVVALVTTMMLGAQAQVLVVGGTSSEASAPKKASSWRLVPGDKLADLLRRDVVPKLPTGARLIRIEADEPLSVPPGSLEVGVLVPTELSSGLQYATAQVRVGRWEKRLPVRLTLALITAQGQLAPLIKRGEEILVVVRTGNVTVQSMGVAQESGGLDQPISVIPNASKRVIRGHVKDARTVEVSL